MDDNRPPVVTGAVTGLEETTLVDDRSVSFSQVAARLTTLEEDLAEIREGQHELLRMYEELREFYPHNCLCAARRKHERREFEALDVFANSTEYEEYRPT